MHRSGLAEPLATVLLLVAKHHSSTVAAAAAWPSRMAGAHSLVVVRACLCVCACRLHTLTGAQRQGHDMAFDISATTAGQAK